MRIESIDAEGGVYRPSAPGASLVVTLEGNVVQTIPLREGVFTIGRLPDNALVLGQASVSRHHAELRVSGGEAALTDLESKSGTFVGGTRLLANQPWLLEPGVAAKIGPYELTLVRPTPLEAPNRPVYDVEVPLPRPSRVVEDDVELTVVARPTFALAAPAATRSRYLRHLPAAFQENEFLGRMLMIFESIWEPLEQRQDHFPMYFDPRTCPGSFIPWMASWVGLTLDAQWPEDRRRRLVAEATELYRWRGTPYGLCRMIEVCTGLTPAVREDPAQPFVFTLTVHIPADSNVRPEVIEDLVRVHKPAHVGYVLEVTS
jgi:phage tail-like protein